MLAETPMFWAMPAISLYLWNKVEEMPCQIYCNDGTCSVDPHCDATV